MPIVLLVLRGAVLLLLGNHSWLVVVAVAVVLLLRLAPLLTPGLVPVPVLSVLVLVLSHLLHSDLFSFCCVHSPQLRLSSSQLIKGPLALT